MKFRQQTTGGNRILRRHSRRSSSTRSRGLTTVTPCHEEIASRSLSVPTRVLIRYYGKRCGIEAGFRDIKDMRFGMGLSSMLYIGKAQEKARVLRTEQRHDPATGASYPWLYSTTAMVNHFYFYAVDDDFGPFFLKFCSYFPYDAKLCLNGHEYLKRQLTKQGTCCWNSACIERSSA